MRTRIHITGGILALGCLLHLGGCTGLGPLERDYGLAHRQAINGQIANPGAGKTLEAEKNPEPVTGLDGKLALGIAARYRVSFGYDRLMDSNNFDLRPISSGPATPAAVNVNMQQGSQQSGAGAKSATPAAAGSGAASSENRSGLP